MSLLKLQSKFNALLWKLNTGAPTSFASTVEAGFEALTLAHVMNEYKRAYGRIISVTVPTHTNFLNQKPGRFRKDRAFNILFASGEEFYFATDIEVFGLDAYEQHRPTGILFEVDVIVIPAQEERAVSNTFQGYPSPSHIHTVYECKFGKYHKSQLRELLGIKRHLSYLATLPSPLGPAIFGFAVSRSDPPIAVKMVRPKRQTFFDRSTADFYELEQVIVK